jgi:hypothetical protein
MAKMEAITVFVEQGTLMKCFQLAKKHVRVFDHVRLERFSSLLKGSWT